MRGSGQASGEENEGDAWRKQGRQWPAETGAKKTDQQEK